MARAAKTKAKQAEEAIEDVEDELEDDGDIEEVDDDDLVLDEDDEDDEIVEEIRPARGKKTKKPKREVQEVTFGVRDLCEWLSEHNDKGKVYQPKDLRNLIRRMAREDNPRVDRDIIAGNKSRYDWPDGLQDPEVKKIIKAVRGGEIESARKEALDALKERKAKKDAAAGKGKSKAKTKAAARERAVDVLEDDDEDEFEDE